MPSTAYDPMRRGDRYGRLTVTQDYDVARSRQRIAVKCDCGAVKTVAESNLRHNTRSCGCRNLERMRDLNATRRRHGHAAKRGASPTYSTWCSMLKRCSNPTTSGYENFGGRGITVCDRWRTFDHFLTDMGVRPDGKTLDRIDPNGNYEPSNCRWATPSEQQRNTRRALGLPSTPTVREALDAAGVPDFGRHQGLGRRIEHLLALLAKHGIAVDETP